MNPKGLKMFYVYEISIVETGEIIYVGKGRGNRYKAKKVNKLLNRLIKDNKCDFKKTMYFDNEQDAFEAERQRINELKAKGQAICNKATYSTGGVSSYWTDEKRAEMSRNNPMKDERQRQRMSENNPMKSKDVAKLVADKRKKIFYIGDKEYVGLKSIAEEYGVTVQCALYWINTGHTSKGEPCGRKSEEILIESISFSEVEQKHTIIYDGVEYPSVKEAIKVAGCANNTFCSWLKRGYSSSGKECRFKDDTNNHEYVNLKSAMNGRKRAVEINGTIYDSIVEASEATGYSVKNLNYYLLHAKNPPVNCRYVNQQPSRTKSDNSSTEGSTTNG